MKLCIAELYPAVLLIVAACSAPPDEQLSLAHKALEIADSLEAEHYAPKEYQLAIEAREMAHNFLSKKNYHKAKEYAAISKNLADMALAKTRKQKDALKTEAERMMVSCQNKLFRLENAIFRAETYYVPHAELLQAKIHLKNLQTRLIRLRLNSSERTFDDILREADEIIEEVSLTTYLVVKMIHAKAANPKVQQI
jgi:hypothetical protein